LKIPDMIAVLEAAERGEAIECRQQKGNSDSPWGKVTDPSWSFDCLDYRIASKKEVLIEDKYHELLYAVGNKYPNETRHETALRYIRQAEEPVMLSETPKEMTLVEEISLVEELRNYSRNQARPLLEALLNRAANRIVQLEAMQKSPTHLYTTDELLDELRRRIEG
jgi:hypothetical protein